MAVSKEYYSEKTAEAEDLLWEAWSLVTDVHGVYLQENKTRFEPEVVKTLSRLSGAVEEIDTALDAVRDLHY